MLAPTINLTILIMMIIIYLNELRHISTFIYNFNYIRDLSKVVMEQKCNSIYCEAETDRYQVAKNSYKLLLPNDVFNSKTYIIMTFVISILIFLYYYYLLFDSQESNKYYYLLNISLLSMLLGMIIYRYVPNDEAGYLNYFKDSLYSDQYRTFSIAIYILLFLVIYSIFQIKYTQLASRDSGGSSGSGGSFIIIVKSLCFLFSIMILFNLTNIVMSFRVNTKPILKTKELIISLKNAFNLSYSKEELTKLETRYPEEVAIYKNWKEDIRLDDSDNIKITTISSVLNILIAFDELAKIDGSDSGGGSGSGGSGSIYVNDDNEINKRYVSNLQKIIKDNNDSINKDLADVENATNVTELSLIFDKKVKIPHNYNKKDVGSTKEHIDEHNANTNNNNPDYVYTADISYDNPTLFYEKYWDMDDSFLSKYAYFVPTFLFMSYSPNLYKIMIAIIVFVVIIIIVFFIGFPLGIIKKLEGSSLAELAGELYTILQPLFVIVVLIIYIIVFISFNTNFNDKVVYKCLDSSYKRSLNKLNNIVTPYIRMYDNKVIKGNKNYISHYIISNVFYSILSGNIKLYAGGSGSGSGSSSSGASSLKAINEAEENTSYYDIARIKSNRLKFSAMNNTILSNDNVFREYYKAKFSKIYKDGYDKNQVELTYNVFSHIFADSEAINSEADIDKYFKDVVFTPDKVFQIYCIIKKCFELFKEDKFNNNLIYYNNHENKQKGINIDAFSKFKFYKYGDTVVPYKFILKLGTIAEYNAFVKDISTTAAAERFKEKIGSYFNITLSAAPKTQIQDTGAGSGAAARKPVAATAGSPAGTAGPVADVADILKDSDEQDQSTQASSMEKLQDKNLIKIITKYLLILGHINYNREEYKRYGGTTATDAKNKKDLYERKTYYLYKLFSNTLYQNTYEIDDTFDTIGVTTDDGLKITQDEYNKYKNLTYIYNYLETKYVTVSSNNNRNYLVNIVKSINNKINDGEDEGKDLNSDESGANKDSRYFFSKRIANMRNPLNYETEDGVLDMANNISTTSFALTYIANIVILIAYFYMISRNNK